MPHSPSRRGNVGPGGPVIGGPGSVQIEAARMLQQVRRFISLNYFRIGVIPYKLQRFIILLQNVYRQWNNSKLSGDSFNSHFLQKPRWTLLYRDWRMVSDTSRRSGGLWAVFCFACLKNVACMVPAGTCKPQRQCMLPGYAASRPGRGISSTATTHSSVGSHFQAKASAAATHYAQRSRARGAVQGRPCAQTQH